MHYKKLTVSLSPNDPTASDLLQAELGDFGFEAFVDTPDGFEGYVQDTLFDPESLNHLNPMVDCVTIKWELSDVPDQNWNQEWERTGFTPIEVDGGRCVVRSTEHQPYPQAILEIIICPEMAFGSGHHQTTQMILKWIMDTQLNDALVLDMGCGTGVLAIGMLKLGARGAKECCAQWRPPQCHAGRCPTARDRYNGGALRCCGGQHQPQYSFG